MKILITAGGTTEKIDDVRAITNNSTGRLGTAIAEAFLKSDRFCIEKIFYVCGQNAVVPKSDKIDILRIGRVAELAAAIEEILTTRRIDAVIHSMAVSDYGVSTVTTKSNVSELMTQCLLEEARKDYQPAEMAAGIVNRVFDESGTKHENKISSDIDDLIIVMKKTPKVISMIKKLQPETILVGFKLLSNADLDTLINAGYNILQKNDCELVLANDLSQITTDSHVGYLIFPDKTFERLETKAQIAETIAVQVAGILENKCSAN